MRVDGFGLFVDDMAKMIRFSRMFSDLKLRKKRILPMFIL